VVDFAIGLQIQDLAHGAAQQQRHVAQRFGQRRIDLRLLRALGLAQQARQLAELGRIQCIEPGWRLPFKRSLQFAERCRSGV